MITCASFFAEQENNKHFQPRMKLKESLNTKTAAATQIDQKLTHERGFECNGERKHGGRCPCELLC